MTFQAYIDTIREKTGKGPDDFRALAAERGLTFPGTKAGDVYDWLSADFGLGRGHAMAIFSILKDDADPRPSSDDRIEKHFGGAKEVWRPSFEALLAEVHTFGDDVGTAPTSTYISLVKGSKKFAIVAATAARLDVGLKLKGVPPAGRLQPAGGWNSMVTHRVQVTDPSEVDGELEGWLRRAYDGA